MNRPYQILTHARELLGSEDNWTRFAQARSRSSQAIAVTTSDDRYAVRWSLEGSIACAAFRTRRRSLARDRVRDRMRRARTWFSQTFTLTDEESVAMLLAVEAKNNLTGTHDLGFEDWNHHAASYADVVAVLDDAIGRASLLEPARASYLANFTGQKE